MNKVIGFKGKSVILWLSFKADNREFALSCLFLAFFGRK